MSAEASIVASAEWAALAAHHEQVAEVQLRELFATDPGRATRMVAGQGAQVLDYSKHRVTEQTIALLLALAGRAQLAERRDAMFAGHHINSTEDPAVLHVAVRMPAGARLEVDGADVVSQVQAVLAPGAEWIGRAWIRNEAVIRECQGLHDAPLVACQHPRSFGVATVGADCVAEGQL